MTDWTPPTLAEIRERWAFGIACQEAVNASCKQGHVYSPILQRAHAIAAAEAMHLEYRQYDGHWNDWLLYRVSRRIVTKAGIAFEAGDWTLVQPSPFPLSPTVAYSFRNGIDTQIRSF